MNGTEDLLTDPMTLKNLWTLYCCAVLFGISLIFIHWLEELEDLEEE